MLVASRLRIRSRALHIACAALIALVSTASGAFAQCTPTYNFGVISNFGNLVPSASPLIAIINTVNTAFLTNTTSLVSAPGGAQADQTSGGIWTRAIGGTVDTKSDSTSTADLTKTTVETPRPSWRPVRCNAIRKSSTTMQVSRLALTWVGSTSLAPASIGTSGSSAGISTPERKKKTLGPISGVAGPSGDLIGHFEVPFIGFYNVITAGNFFADAQFRWDFYDSTASSVQQRYSGVNGRAQSLSFTTAAAYRIPLPSNWFVEPSFGGVLSQTKVDPIVTPLVDGVGTSTLRISDINSVLGRASLRIGTSFTQGSITWQPFVAATVLHEFAGSVMSTQTLSDPALSSLDKGVFTTETLRIGTYEQIGFGTAVVIGKTGWLGYGRGDVKFGENTQGWGANFGLRYQW